MSQKLTQIKKNQIKNIDYKECEEKCVKKHKNSKKSAKEYFGFFFR